MCSLVPDLLISLPSLKWEWLHKNPEGQIRTGSNLKPFVPQFHPNVVLVDARPAKLCG